MAEKSFRCDTVLGSLRLAFSRDLFMRKDWIKVYHVDNHGRIRAYAAPVSGGAAHVQLARNRTLTEVVPQETDGWEFSDPRGFRAALYVGDCPHPVRIREVPDLWVAEKTATPPIAASDISPVIRRLLRVRSDPVSSWDKAKTVMVWTAGSILALGIAILLGGSMVNSIIRGTP